MLEQKIKEIAMTTNYDFIQRHCGHCDYNTEAYKTMLKNLTGSNESGRPGMIFKVSW